MSTDFKEAIADLRKRLEAIGAEEVIDTALAFFVTQKLGDIMRKSYSQRREQTIHDLVNLSDEWKSNPKTIALGAMVDGFLVGWMGDKLK